NDDPRVDGAMGPPPLAATVEYVAPAPVVVAAGLGAPREVRGGDHHAVVGAMGRRQVGFAPAYVENGLARVGIGLTPGAVCARDIRGVRKVIHHRPSAHAIAPPACRMPSEVSGFRGGIREPPRDTAADQLVGTLRRGQMVLEVSA